MDTFAGGFFLVFGFVLVSVLGLLLTRRLMKLESLKDSHEVGGYLLSVVGTLYAVLLGLIVVDSMAKFQEARQVVEEEANSLADVFNYAGSLPEPKRTQIRKGCMDYADEVVNKEWPLMDKDMVDLRARALIVGVNMMARDFEPVTENQKAVYPLLLSAASDVWHQRRDRTNFALHGPPLIEWVSLIAGSIITVFFTYFFGLENLKIQIVMTSMVAFLISLNLYLFTLFSYPFSGDLTVDPEPFRVDEMIFHHRLNTPDGKPILDG